MKLFKKNEGKKTEKLPMSGKVRKGFRFYCTAVMALSLVVGTSVTAFAANDPIAVVNNLSDFIFGLVRAVGMIICMIAAVCLLGAAAFCGFRIYSHYAHESEQEEVFEKIAEVVEQAQTGESETVDVLLTEEETVLAEYGELYLQNTDMVGWLSIAGTNINYPVMQTPNNPNYYLKHNFEKEYSDLGTPYVQENCDLLTSDNLVIYGHHIKGQKMFGALENYKSKDFYEEHKTVCFDTLTKRGEYEIVAVFKTVAYSSAGFRYYDFVDTEDENAFNAYIAKCKELALYDTGVTAEYGDRLITLSTCEYSAQNGRLVVVAKKVA